MGVSEPISLNPPTPAELEMTNQLVDTLKRSNFFESDEEGYKREIVLGRLNEIVRSYVRQKALEQGIPEEEASEAGGKIYTFGSYRLGVHSKGADIDTLCVVPMHVSRHDFFTSFSERLKECPEVTELTQVPDAYVPIMRLVFDGIPVRWFGSIHFHCFKMDPLLLLLHMC